MTTDTDPPEMRLRRALEGIGATIVRADERGDLDFSLDGMDGFARERRGRFRASFFIEYDPDPVEAEEWVSATSDLAFAEAQHIELADGAALRVLVELPFDEHQQLWEAAQTARALHTAWTSRQRGWSDLVERLGSAGIALPPPGCVAIDGVSTYGPWSWGSRYIPPIVLYMFEAELIARQLIDHGPMFAMAHAGHGLNSYGLSLVSTSPSGAVAAYVQHGYGGVYANPVADLVDINATYSRLRVLWQATEEREPENLRWLLVYSQFRGTCGVLDLAQLRRGHDFETAFEPLDSEAAIFQSITERLVLRDIDFGTCGSVSW